MYKPSSIEICTVYYYYYYYYYREEEEEEEKQQQHRDIRDGRCQLLKRDVRSVSNTALVDITYGTR